MMWTRWNSWGPLLLLATGACGEGAEPAAVTDTAADVDASGGTADVLLAADTSPADAASTDAGPPAEVPTASTSTQCPGGAANATGLGKPCSSGAECQGQAAVTCPRENDPKGMDFCTFFCFGVKPDECGPDGACIALGDKPSVCAPAKCEKALRIPPPTPVKVKVPCPDGVPNAYGVGKPCAVVADCAANTVAKSCPKAVKPENPPWCSLLCAKDEDCGPDAFCWKRKSNEASGTLVASCALKSCIIP